MRPRKHRYVATKDEISPTGVAITRVKSRNDVKLMKTSAKQLLATTLTMNQISNFMPWFDYQRGKSKEP